MRRLAKRFAAVLSVTLMGVVLSPVLSAGDRGGGHGGGGHGGGHGGGGHGGGHADIISPKAKPYGKTYGEWSAEFWKWLIALPAAENPGIDDAFAANGQKGPVWFLAGLFGSGEVTRTIDVPAGKAVFFPIMNWVWWAPDDLGTAASVAEHLGFSPEEIAAMSDEELIRLIANYAAGTPEMTLTIDGRDIKKLLRYHAESPAFPILDTDLLDDFGAPISQPNLAVASGYWIMLAPLSVGKHTIHLTSVNRHSIPDFDTETDITFNITVVPQRCPPGR